MKKFLKAVIALMGLAFSSLAAFEQDGMMPPKPLKSVLKTPNTRIEKPVFFRRCKTLAPATPRVLDFSEVRLHRVKSADGSKRESTKPKFFRINSTPSVRIISPLIEEDIPTDVDTDTE